MDTKELPAHPSLEQYKKQAKELLKNVKSGDSKGLQHILKRLGNDHSRAARLGELEVLGAKLRLADAQFVIARDYGFESWPKFAKHIEELTSKNSPASRFESAVDAIVFGDVPKLERLLRETPGLIRERSARLHHATLLHYVGANGVENYRQKTPKNIVNVAEVLVRAGAGVNAIADIYGKSDSLGLAATSVWPALAGVQEALLDFLLNHGAKMDDPQLVSACLANGRGRAAEHLARRGAPLDLEGAAGVGNLDVVQSFFNDDGRLKRDATQKQMERGFIWACEFGKTEVVVFLLEQGAKVDATPRGETGLHWAAFTGRREIVKQLLAHNAQVNMKDKSHHQTPLEWAIYAWGDPPVDAERGGYYEVAARLVNAGAALEPAWIDAHPNVADKIRADSRMMAALRGEMLD